MKKFSKISGLVLTLTLLVPSITLAEEPGEPLTQSLMTSVSAEPTTPQPAVDQTSATPSQEGETVVWGT